MKKWMKIKYIRRMKHVFMLHNLYELFDLWIFMDIIMDMFNTHTILITPEILSMLSKLDEFK